MKRSLELVEILWVDSFIHGEWSEYEKPKRDDCLVATYGLLVEKSKDWVVVAMTHVTGKAPYWGSLWHIPRGMVVQVNKLAVVPVEPRTRDTEIEHSAESQNISGN